MTDDPQSPPPPEGFEPMPPRKGFQLHNGPFFQRLSEADPTMVEHALFILPRHVNGLGVLHGGMLSTFLDGVLGGAVVRVAAKPCVTVHLSVDFMRMARRGDWLRGEARVTRATRELVFSEGRALVGEHVVGRATGVFKLMGRRG